MLKKLAHALHHLFNPHCELCDSLLREERERQREHDLELRVCQSCETLKTQLEFQNQIIRELTRKPEPEVTTDANNFRPIMPKHKPWRVKQMELEKQDRELAARLKADKEKEITLDNLDSELEELQNAQSS